MQLSRNFTLEEMTHSETAIQRGLENRPDGAAVTRLTLLAANVLQPIRDRFGPCAVDSGFRTPEVNECVHGEAHSQHLLGEACDFRPMHASLEEVADWILENIEFDQLIVEAGVWLHVSYTTDRDNRREALTGYRVDGKMRYKPYRQ